MISDSGQNAIGEGGRVRNTERVLPVMRAPRCRASEAASPAGLSRNECLEQLLEAFVDIADRDDIHQAAERLARVQDWIRAETATAAADPIFAALRLAS